LLVIRKAELSDALRLAQLQEHTFRDTFGDTNTPEDLALHCEAHFGQAIQQGELSDPRFEILVCESEGSLVGYAQVRVGEAPDCVHAERPIEIQRFYLVKAWHGRGLANDLMAAAIGVAEDRGADVVWLGVWEHNPRAIAFYERGGFVKVGDHVFPLGTDPNSISSWSVRLGRELPMLDEQTSGVRYSFGVR